MKNIIVMWTVLLCGMALAAAPASEPTAVPASEPTTAPRSEPTTAPSSQPTTIPTTAPVSMAATREALPAVVQPAQTAPGISSTAMSSEYAILSTRSIFLKGHQRVASGYTYSGSSRSNDSIATTQAGSLTPQQNLVFNGVTLADDRADGLIEDLTANKVTIVRVGDTVAGGKIVDITLDTMDFQIGDKLLHILIGQNLEGVDATPASTQPSGLSGGATTAPSASNADAVLERLRQRRLQEMGGH